jgi:hypothetical protein
MSKKIIQNNWKSSQVTAKEACKNAMSTVSENFEIAGKKQGGVDEIFCYD